MKKFYIIILIGILIIQVEAQTEKKLLSGNLQADAHFLLSQNASSIQKTEKSIMPVKSEVSGSGEKSPFLGGIFSLIVPGAGEFYSESYLKAGIFLAIEAAVVTTAIIYNKKGDNKTNDFQNYADQNWSVVKYARWIVDHKDQLGLPDNLTYSDIIIKDDPSLPPWDQVNFNRLNYYESQSSSFTHQLASHGEQQYYELIGKYHQFSPGWAEFNSADNDTHDIPPQFLYYSGMRGKANDYYNFSQTAVKVIYLNHFLSALDGIWSAITFNKDMAVNARVETLYLGDRAILIPTLKVRYNF